MHASTSKLEGHARHVEGMEVRVRRRGRSRDTVVAPVPGPEHEQESTQLSMTIVLELRSLGWWFMTAAEQETRRGA